MAELFGYNTVAPSFLQVTSVRVLCPLVGIRLSWVHKSELIQAFGFSCYYIGKTDAEAKTPNTLATSREELTHWKRPWCWEGLGAGGEGDDRGWNGWMASPTRWAWVWVNSGCWWWTGRPGVLWFMGSQRVGHDWMTELNWCWERGVWSVKDLRHFQKLPRCDLSLWFFTHKHKLTGSLRFWRNSIGKKKSVNISLSSNAWAPEPVLAERGSKRRSCVFSKAHFTCGQVGDG